MSTHSMNAVDAAWFRMGSPANPAIVNGLVTTCKRLLFAAVKAVLQQRLLRFDRFRQRVVVRPAGRPVSGS